MKYNQRIQRLLTLVAAQNPTNLSQILPYYAVVDVARAAPIFLCMAASPFFHTSPSTDPRLSTD